VLDPFLGSGTTAEVAVRLGRFALGFEIDRGYCEIAANRMRSVEAALSLPPRAQALLNSDAIERAKGVRKRKRKIVAPRYDTSEKEDEKEEEENETKRRSGAAGPKKARRK